MSEAIAFPQPAAGVERRRILTYLNERNPTAAGNLDAEISPCIDRLAAQEFEGPVSRLHSDALVRSRPVRSFRIY